MALLVLPLLMAAAVPIRATDGPAGVTIHRPAIAMPAPVALASTFDDTLARGFGEVLGRDGRAFNQDVIFSPMVNNIRVPQGGRNFETFSEDPLLTARMAAEEVRGIQSQGLMATVKHYAANTQETDRMGVNVDVAERTLRELELPGFQAAVDAGAAAVMCAYPKVNGEAACGNRHLLDEILKEQWGFRGWVTSDWLATHSTDAIAKGLDQELGVEVDPSGGLVEGKYLGAALKAAVERGDIPMSEVDDSAGRILTQLDRFGLLDEQKPPRPDRDVPGGTRVAKEVAESGAVLLRNQDGALPLDPESTRDIAVIGPTAKTPKVTGLGSSYVLPDHATPPLDAITARLGEQGRVGYSVGEELAGERIPDSALRPAFPGGEVFPPGGGGVVYDGTLEVPRDGLYRLAARTTGGNATMRVDGGPEIGVGEVFGELTSVPLRLTAGSHRLLITGGEGIFSGYRWYDRENVRPLFPFGHGLSYTSFEYHDPVLRRTGDGFEITLTVRNTGHRQGSDVVQVYLGPGPEATVDQSVRALAGYQKVALAPGAAQRVRIHVPEQALRYWDPATGAWRLGGGTRAVEIGRSSAQIEWKGEIRA